MTDRDLYKDSGVDIGKGDELVRWLKSKPSETRSKFGRVEKGIGGFAGLFRLEFSQLKQPLLVSGTDGVGTKLLLGLEENNLHGIGQDLVAMCVNDLYCVGATPLFFLDYFATGKLDAEQFKTILASIQTGLAKCNTALLGGETAEMPGLYQERHFDLCGFVVGVVDESKQLGPHRVALNDDLIAIASSGFHSNGYSLIRKLFTDHPQTRQKYAANSLVPTAIYGMMPEIVNDIGVNHFHALANITGGGISGNLNRVLPADMDALISGDSVRVPQWMQDFLDECEVTCMEVESALNLGVGMVAVCAPERSDELISSLERAEVEAYKIGHIGPGKGEVIFNSKIGK